MDPAVHHNSSDYDTIPDKHLSPVQAQVIAALAQGRTATDAARDAGIHRTTIHHWFRTEPLFKSSLQQAQREYVETLHDGMRNLAARAVETLRSLLDDPKTPPAVRLRTALAVLQRPRFPKQGWTLPERIESPREQEVIDQLMEVEADFRAMRMSEALQANAKQKQEQPSPSEPIARNAPCPCGSGNKYKRCCGSASAGKFTPPVSQAPGVAA
jgi:AcrR family transcriptional regulator